MLDSDCLSQRVAIVTGAGQGMGRAVAQALGARGTKIVVNDLSQDTAEQTAASVKSRGGQAIAIRGDVSDAKDVSRVVDGAVHRYGQIDILVNNAGIVRPTKVIDIDEDEWDLVVKVNLKGTYMFSRAVLPHMQAIGRGRIVNFSSTAGRKYSTIGGAHYSASKAGVLGFTRHLAKEVAGYGITVNAVCPGLIDTEMVRSTISDQQIEAYAGGFPISRLGKPEEVAELVTFLVSDKAAYITGASLDINGGDLMK